MNRKRGIRTLSDKEIDRVVVAQADDNSAWEKPVRVLRAKPTALHLPSEVAARAAFFARLHREASVEKWLTRVIQERIDLEEAAFAGLKRDLTAKRKG